jgi:L-malate glycosyltransferase
MRALVISHTYIAHDNRAKWTALTETKRAEIDLHLPQRWPSWESEYRSTAESNNGFQIHTSHVLRKGREDQYFFAPTLFRGLRDHEFDILHVEQGSAALVYAQALFERNLVSCKTKTCFFTWINWEYQLRWPWTIVEPYNLKHSDGAIGGNLDAIDLLRRRGYRGKVAVIPQLGVDTDFYSPAPNEELRKKYSLEGVVIGFIGRLVEEKGIRILLEAAQKISDNVTVLLLGSGPLEAELHDMKKRANVVHVKAVPHDEVRNFIRAMDILVLPSYATPKWKEQFGHVLIEAMACEVPVIGSSSAAIPEVIGDAGLIFKEHSSDELSQHLQTLTQCKEERVRFGQLGRQRVLKHFTHSEIARQTLEFWKTL